MMRRVAKRLEDLLNSSPTQLDEDSIALRRVFPGMYVGGMFEEEHNPAAIK